MGVTWDEALEGARGRLSDGALAHSLRTADAAGRLAQIYGLDAGEARLAGLLHDWDRDVTAEDLVVQADGYGIESGGVYAGSPRLLHAMTGARAVAAAFPGLSAEVVSAIEKHTVGAAEMSPLDQVVYVADMIEDGRAYRGVDDLREAVGSVSLDELFALAYQQTVLHLVRSRKVMHPTTLEVYNSAVARGHDERR